MAIVTLVSGGLDSTLMSLMANEVGATLYPLFIDYGQLSADKEWEACQRLHDEFRLPRVIRMDLSGFGKIIPSGLTNSKFRVNEDAFLPGRNLLLVLTGAAHAFSVQANNVAIGLLNPGTRLFPDQTKEFAQEAERIIEMTTDRRIRVLTPLIEFTKTDILAMARERGIKHTYSCHAGGNEPCGACIACLEIVDAKEGNSHGWISSRKRINSKPTSLV